MLLLAVIARRHVLSIVRLSCGRTGSLYFRETCAKRTAYAQRTRVLGGSQFAGPDADLRVFVGLDLPRFGGQGLIGRPAWLLRT
jgi:hypothetical protein